MQQTPAPPVLSKIEGLSTDSSISLSVSLLIV